MTDLEKRFLDRAGLSEHPSLSALVNALKEIPYGRTSPRSPKGLVTEWRGTCSTKHALLAELLSGRPAFDLALVHRVYRISRADASRLFGEDAARSVPDDGLVDVHTYATLLVEGERVTIDVTFPGGLWDGRSDMPLACGEGDDYPAGADPWTLKAELVERFCDPAVREPFIAALAS